MSEQMNLSAPAALPEKSRRTMNLVMFCLAVMAYRRSAEAFQAKADPKFRRRIWSRPSHLTRQLSSIGFDSSMSTSATRTTERPSAIQVPNRNDISSSLISHLAECALQLRLHSHSGVSCDVSADPARMLASGSVGPVTVKGRGWKSPLGLTCRAIEATVETCQLDFGRVIRDRKLRLTKPAKGKAMVALTSEDFGNFITHPLLKSQIPQVNGFQLLKDNVLVDGGSNQVIFHGEAQGSRYQCTLTRRGASGGALVQVQQMSTSDSDSSAEQMSKELSSRLSQFFNQLVFELDGTFLRFHDMMIMAPRNSGPTTLMLALSIEVHKFPSPGMAF